jgi:hypothetical protein
MGKVLAFPTPREAERLRGPARCVRCAHEWECVSPVGVYAHLECPSCHTDTGVRLGLVAPGTRFVCACGNDLYFVQPDGCLCVQCGRLATL